MTSNAIDFMQFTETESRLTSRLIKYWKSLKGINNVPLEKNIDNTLISDLWDNCFILRVHEINRSIDYRYDYIGKNICEAYTKDLSRGDNILINLEASGLHEKYIEIIRLKRPIEHQGTYINNNDKIIKFRQCMIPFSSDGKNVTTIIGAMNYKMITRV